MYRTWIASIVFVALLLGAPSFADVRVASFNIQFLGQFKKRDNYALAHLLKDFDLVFVQELVAPPHDGTFPDGAPYRPDPEAAAFFDAMQRNGFAFVLSPEDTGTGVRNHLNSSATEWFVAFYRPDKVATASDLPSGFLAEDRTNNRDYERVPYAFAFRADSEDLVFISVHLQPGGGGADAARRAHEIASIADWISAQSGSERDYVILGDMNIENCDELHRVLPARYVSLNSTCLPTNTNVNGRKPYDHVMYQPAFSSDEIPNEFEVIDLIEAMRPYWDASKGVYPGSPYNHNVFRQFFSDHDPVTFRIIVDGIDDD